MWVFFGKQMDSSLQATIGTAENQLLFLVRQKFILK